jgi:hypothetical protein
MNFKYREEVLTELARHGVAPRPETDPELVHDFINGLYLFEIRSLKSRLVAGLLRRNEYAGHVAELRKRYPILSVPVVFWTIPD